MKGAILDDDGKVEVAPYLDASWEREEPCAICGGECGFDDFICQRCWPKYSAREYRE